MKRFLILTFMGSLLLVGRSFANEKDAGEFPLTVHITAVEMKQGVRGVSGSGSTDSNGNYSSSVSGGGSYTWHLYTAQIDGNNKTYGLSTRAMHYKGGPGLAMATMGWSAIATGRRNAQLHLGRYRGRWNKDGTLEIQFTQKGGLKHQTFRIESEKLSVALSVVPAPALAPAAPAASQQQSIVPVDPATQTTAQPVREAGSSDNAARRAKQYEACLDLAKNNPSITCK